MSKEQQQRGPKGPHTIFINMRMSEDLARRLDRYAAGRGISVSAAARELIDLSLEFAGLAKTWEDDDE